MNQPSKAKASLEEALKQNENDVIVWLQLSVGYENNFLYQVLRKLAELMLSSGEFDEAISFYRRLIEIDDSNAKSWNDLGECYMKKKKYLMVNFNASNVTMKD